MTEGQDRSFVWGLLYRTRMQARARNVRISWGITEQWWMTLSSFDSDGGTRRFSGLAESDLDALHEVFAILTVEGLVPPDVRAAYDARGWSHEREH